jgi:hypothetical protein
MRKAEIREAADGYLLGVMPFRKLPRRGQFLKVPPEIWEPMMMGGWWPALRASSIISSVDPAIVYVEVSW